MLVDTFMFRDELDMLQCRLEELSPIVDRFVLVESRTTHRNVAKPLHYAKNRDRFAPWHDKIVHVVADLPGDPDPWVNEHAQRDAARIALADLGDDDVIMISDVDEFPPRGFGPQMMPELGVVAFSQILAMYAADWIYPIPQVCSVAAGWGWLKGRSLPAVRDARNSYPAISGGWHITWLGGIKGQREKLETATCHLEMRPDEYDRLWSGACYEQGVHHSGECQMNGVDVDGSWPAYIAERRCPPSWFRPREGSCA